MESTRRFLKSNRILKRDAFVRTYEKGRKVHAKHFTAFVLPNDGGPARIGITTTRKIGNAVERNRARRLVREVFRRNRWLVPSGVDIVINVKKHLSKCNYQDIENDFISFLEKVSEK
jgi:ribonuclease P protein component